MMQLVVRFHRGDWPALRTISRPGLEFFDDPVFKQNPTGGAIVVFGWASWNAWMLGRADVARERMAKMRAAVNPAYPHDLAWSDVIGAGHYALTRENERAETLAAQALELCEKHNFPNDAAISRCFLDRRERSSGRTAEGIALIRQGIDAILKIGTRTGVPGHMTSLAAAQLGVGAIADALETVERALNFNPEEAVGRPETLRIRGELRLKQGESATG